MYLFLIVSGAIVLWLLRAYFLPFAPCRRCKGVKVNAATRLFTPAKRFGLCRSCGGTGARQVLGSRQVHKAVQSLLAYRNKEK